ncbi:MAG: hypothetical protein ACREBV_05500 [Candidatus Zixiibacteriota bacterium]
MKYGLLCIILLLTMACNVWSQTTLNPDISAIGEMSVFTHDDEARPSELKKFNLTQPNLELNFNGYLNPYARADAVVAWEGDENAVLEEFYATFLRGLPLNMNLRAGKYRLEFGRLNPIHPHAYSFIELPMVHEEFFGEEGLNDVAIRTSFYLPTGKAYSEIMGAVTKGNALLEEDALEGYDTTHLNPGAFGRLTTSLAVIETAELSLGTSFFNSVYELEPSQLRASIFGGDFKYKNVISRYSTLLFEGEFLYRSLEQDSADNVNSTGGYAYIDYKFHKVYNVGGMFEFTKVNSIKVDSLGTPVEVSAGNWRGALFIGFAPIEETSLIRLAGHWTKPEETDGVWELALQFVFSLGPHKPHNF